MRGPAFTGTQPLPGGDFPLDGVAALEARLGDIAPGLDSATRTRMVSAYGTDALAIAADLGADLGHGLHEGEVRWMVEREWAMSAEDILWRRSKLGLVFAPDERQTLENRVEEIARPQLAAE